MNSVHVDDRYLVQKALGDAVDGVRPYDVEYRIVRTDGEERVLHSRGEVQRAEKGRAIRMLGMSLDITDRKKAQAALRESEERYRAVFDNAGIGIDLVGRDGKFVQANNALKRMLGYTDKEFYQLKEDENQVPRAESVVSLWQIHAVHAWIADARVIFQQALDAERSLGSEPWVR